MNRFRYRIIAALCATGFFAAEVFSIITITEQVATPFGTYTPGSRQFTSSVAPYTVPEDLNGVLYKNAYSFSDTAMALLEKNGFVAVPSAAQSMTSIYKATSDQNLPVFVTTDVALHCFYKIYDYMLRIAEYKRFRGGLDSMLHSMIGGIAPLCASAGADSAGLAVRRTAALLGVARTLLTDTMTFISDPAIAAIVTDELSLIHQHKGFATSKVVPDYAEDYSQYVPRGHYTIDTAFGRYFRCMMYLGRMHLRVTNGMETMMACILTRLLSTTGSGSVQAKDLWAAIYHPTTFFAGRSDDLNFLQYAGALDRALGAGWSTGDIGIFHTRLNAITAELKKLPKPLILSGLDGNPGFRVMGQRFIPDSYMFGRLVVDYVDGRYFPRGLDILAVLGSRRARHHLIELYHEDGFQNYTRQLDSLTDEFNAKEAPQWVDNLYWNWLYTLVPLLRTWGKGYPFFMTTPAWSDKSLASASGSWAELRHASILYGKQSYGTVGIHEPQCKCFPQSYVEPNPELFGRLSALASYMKGGFEKAGLSPILPLGKLTELSAVCADLRDIAIDELEGKVISIKRYCAIANAYKGFLELEDFSRYKVPPSSNNTPEPDTSTAVIADVFTDPNSSRVLEVGIGKPMCLYVVVPVEGKLQVCRGAMFSYYEFKQPMENRLTDAQWQVMLAQTNPAMPEWTGNFTASKEKSPYKVIEEDLTVFISADDSIPAFVKSGESAVAIVHSKTTPSIRVEAKGTAASFQGVLLSEGKYRVVIPPEALADTAILTISSVLTGISGYGPAPDVPITYRRVIRTGLVSVAAGRKTVSGNARPRFRSGRLIVPPGTAWRVVDGLGRQVAFIGPDAREWVPPSKLGCKQLLLMPAAGRKERPVRFVTGD